MSLVRSFSSVGILTLVSRILGFVRVMLMARFLGASFATDAFLIALRLPNMFRALFAEGAFASAFVPVVQPQDRRGGGKLEQALRFADEALAVLLPFLIAVHRADDAVRRPGGAARSRAGSTMPTPAQFAFAVELARITFPYLLFISLVSLLGGILNSLHKFWVNAAAPILLNLCLIARDAVLQRPDRRRHRPRHGLGRHHLGRAAIALADPRLPPRRRAAAAAPAPPQPRT